jgi:hypothetical protein
MLEHNLIAEANIQFVFAFDSEVKLVMLRFSFGFQYLQIVASIFDIILYQKSKLVIDVK